MTEKMKGDDALPIFLLWVEAGSALPDDLMDSFKLNYPTSPAGDDPFILFR